MSSIEKGLRIGVVGVGLMAGCSAPPVPPELPAGDRPTASAARPDAGVAPGADPAAVRPPAKSPSRVVLGAPGPVRNWNEVRLQAAQRLMAANPDGTYDGPVVEPLLGIPVLEIELNADGSVRRIVVLRQPQEARFVSKIAEDAVRRAAPFGDVSRLPRPWRFTETFLFNEERKFKPRTLDR